MQKKSAIARQPTDVGPDPIKWLARLLDVNESSRFTDHEKNLIHGALSNLIRQLFRESKA